jgi:hypothetical protein
VVVGECRWRSSLDQGALLSPLTCRCRLRGQVPVNARVPAASGCRGNEYRDIAVQVCQTAIERRQLPFAASCELSKVSIGHLSVTDHTTDLYIGERDAVRPELVTVCTFDRADDIPSNYRGLTRPHQETNKTPLCDRARCKCSTGYR